MSPKSTVPVFVSHSREDDDFTLRLVNDLRRAGADTWVDTAEISHDDFVKSINEGLAGCKWLLLVMTPSALKSPWVEREVNAALYMVVDHRMLGIISIVAKPCREEEIPPTWATLNRHDATQDYEAALRQVLKALRLSDITPTLRSAEPAPIPESTTYVDVLAKVPLFSNLSKELLRRLSAVCREREYPAGTVLLRQGETGVGLITVANGRLQVTQRDQTGDERDLGVYDSGVILGEMSLIDDLPRTATVTAFVAVRVITLSVLDFRAVVREYPDIGLQISADLAHRLRIAESRAG
jgi:hypothetical protein